MLAQAGIHAVFPLLTESAHAATLAAIA